LKEETLLAEESAGGNSRPSSGRVSPTKSSKDSRPSSAKENELDVLRPSSARPSDSSRPNSATIQQTEVDPENKDEEKKNPDMSSEDLHRIHQLFNLFDEDNSGSMSSAELGKLMRSLGMFPTDLEVEALVSSMDEDKSGQIELPELVQHMGLQIQLRSKLNPEKDFADAFKVFDRDGNGYISCTELRRVLTERGQMPLSNQEVEELIEAVDVDHDNQLNYSEFVQLFTQQLVL